MGLNESAGLGLNSNEEAEPHEALKGLLGWRDLSLVR